MQEKKMRWCCYIIQDGGQTQGQPCKKDAVWEIYSQQPGQAPYDCTTDSCTTHVGLMLDDSPEHIIRQIHND